MKKIKKYSSKKLKNISYALLTIFLIFTCEIISLLLLNIFPNLTYDQNKITQTEKEYLIKRDSILGWNKTINKYENSRNLPNRIYVSNKSKEIDFYGDSYTYGAEVEDDRLIWTNLISKKLNVIVNNKGVGGYGSDQSFLKFLLNKTPNEIIVLNHLSENIIRNVNQFRHLIYPSNYYDLKPRFIIHNDTLSLIKIPDLESKFVDFKKNPNKFLDYEYFKIGSESGIYIKSFPFSLTLFKSLTSNWKIKAIFRHFSGYQPFYETNHKSNGLKLTNLILSSFVKESRKRSVVPITTVLPTYRDFEYYEKYKILPYQNLISKLDTSFFIIDFGKEIIDRQSNFELDKIRKLYVSEHGHMNKFGHETLSSIFSEFIKTKKIL